MTLDETVAGAFVQGVKAIFQIELWDELDVENPPILQALEESPFPQEQIELALDQHIAHLEFLAELSPNLAATYFQAGATSAQYIPRAVNAVLLEAHSGAQSGRLTPEQATSLLTFEDKGIVRELYRSHTSLAYDIATSQLGGSQGTWQDGFRAYFKWSIPEDVLESNLRIFEELDDGTQMGVRRRQVAVTEHINRYQRLHTEDSRLARAYLHGAREGFEIFHNQDLRNLWESIVTGKDNKLSMEERIEFLRDPDSKDLLTKMIYHSNLHNKALAQDLTQSMQREERTKNSLDAEKRSREYYQGGYNLYSTVASISCLALLAVAFYHLVIKEPVKTPPPPSRPEVVQTHHHHFKVTKRRTKVEDLCSQVNPYMLDDDCYNNMNCKDRKGVEITQEQKENNYLERGDTCVLTTTKTQ